MRRAALAAVLIGVGLLVWLVWSGAESDGSLRFNQPDDMVTTDGPVLLGSVPQTRAPDPAVDEGAGDQDALVRYSGRVIDENGQPVEGAAIGFQWRGSAPMGGPAMLFRGEPQCRADADGRFILEWPNTWQPDVCVHPDKEWSESLALASSTISAGEQIVLQVRRMPNLTGTVYDQHGAVAQGVPLRAADELAGWSSSAETSAAGQFAVRVPPGLVRVSLRVGIIDSNDPPPHGCGVALPDISVPAQALEISLLQPVSVSGEVLDIHGHLTAASVDFVLLDEGLGSLGRVIAVSDGHFGPYSVRPGIYAVRARPGDRRSASPSAPQVVTVPGPRIQLQLGAPRVIHGRLLGDDVGDFRVRVQRNDPHFGIDQRDISTAADGSFELAIGLGSLHLLANRRGDDRYADVELDEAVSSVEVALVVGQRIEGTRSGGAPYAGARILARQGSKEIDAVIQADGTFSLCGLPAGAWEIFETQSSRGENWAVGWAVPRNLIVEAGTTDLVLR
ncbi:MAG: carboxypeptidase-like regulatory domain-containing protein [Planctomycetota bacterium]